MPEPTQLLVDIGEISLCVYHWPPSDTEHSNKNDPVLLLHATGFHARCWHEVVKLLPGQDVYAADLRFHGNSGALGPVDWEVMAQDILKLLQTLNLSSVLGVGHSIGGHLLARVAAHHNALFKHLVLVDPVITSPERYALFREHSATLKIEDHPVARRKNAWENAQQMQDRFREREPFNSWQPAVLEDYCNYALKPAGPEGLHQLACDPLDEAAVYMNQTGNEVILDLLTDINVPVTLLRAPPGDSDVPNFSHSPTWPEIARLLPDCTEVFLPDHNHFIPMQDPELVARHIRAVS